MTLKNIPKEIKNIRIPNMRLTLAEKEEIYNHIQIFPEDNNTETLKEYITYSRQLEKQIQKEKKETRKFVKEIRRLERKYNCFDYEHKTLDELTDMWWNDYFELYFKDCHLESIMYYGAKEYAQVYLHTRGIIPHEEVTLWQK